MEAMVINKLHKDIMATPLMYNVTTDEDDHIFSYRAIKLQPIQAESLVGAKRIH